MKHGQQDVLELGNLDAQRDWGYAGDYAEGMWLMLQQDKPDDYVLATGETFTVRRFVEETARAFDREVVWEGTAEQTVGRDRKTGKVCVRVNPEFYRPAEVDVLLGNPAKAQKCLGWQRKTNFVELVEMMARADDERVVRGALSF